MTVKENTRTIDCKTRPLAILILRSLLLVEVNPVFIVLEYASGGIACHIALSDLTGHCKNSCHYRLTGIAGNVSELSTSV